MNSSVQTEKSPRRPLAAVTGASSGIGLELARCCADHGFDLLIGANEPEIQDAALELRAMGLGMRTRHDGRILIAGSIAGFMPGSFAAVYNGTKAFLDSFALALRNELKDSGVTVTCLMPGPTDTEFFERAHMQDTKVATAKKDDAADVARIGFEAMMKGSADVVTGLKNKLEATVASVMPAEVLAERHRKMAKPGTAKKR